MSQIRVLIVDDDEVFRERLAKVFRENQYLVETAKDIANAQKLVETFRPTHAVIDLRIGSDSGLDVVKLLSIENSCRIVILTGYGSIASAIEAVRLGAINYLTKPTTFSEIKKALLGDPLIPVGGNSKSATVPSLDDVQWEHIQRVMRDCSGNITHAAAKLGVHRQALQRKLKKMPTTSR